MSTDLQRHDLKPPPPQLDEGYWAALLAEGEHAQSFLPDGDISESRTDFDEFVGSEEHFYTTSREVSDEDWTEIQRIASSDEVVELKIVGYNRGGLLAEWRSLRGFVPASQLVDFPSTSNSPIRRDALIQRVGQSLLLRVIEISADKNRLILSERAAQAEPGQRADILSALKAGDIVTGIVTNLCDFGAFVDLGGLEGLIHISELSWGRVGHPDSLLKRGEQINVYVLGVDRDSARIALSVKRLRPDPWQTVEQRYQSGEIVEGVITNVVDFGAFACIEEGLEGLIHVSELAEGHFLHPRNVVSEGQHVRARIIAISGPERRLGLSLRLNTD